MINLSTLNRAVLGAFFLSGVSALIYQVVWMRMLTLTFGATVFAVSAVLSAFMAGLALGAWAFGRLADRAKQPILFYVVLELGIGAYALLTPWLFQHIDTVYAPLLHGLTDDFYLLSLVRFVLAFAVIVAGAALMGGTLPVLSKFYVHSAGEVGKDVGSLYALNTFGAVLGVIVSGFILIPLAGVSVTLHTAVFINLFIGIGLALLVWRSVPATGLSKPAVPSQAEMVIAGDPRARWVLVAFAVSGFAALAYEVIWTRILMLVIGSSTYAFSIMLLTFLLGLALGSAIMSRYLPRLAAGREYLVFALIQIGIAVTVLLAAAFIGKLPLLFMSLAKIVPPNFFGILLMQLGLAFLLMLPPTLLLGALFPLVCRMYGGGPLDGLGARIGRLYGANTAGAILGAFAAGFVLIPLLGSELSLKGLTWLNTLLGVLFLFFLVARDRWLMALWPGLALLGGLLLNSAVPPWNPLVMNSNFPQALKVIAKDSPLLDDYLDSEVLYSDEDVSDHVLVYRGLGDSTNLHVSGHAEGGSHKADMPVQVQLAALPALISARPEKVLVVGLGVGITLGALEQMEGVKEIDVVEISTAVVRANHFFNEYNHSALEDPRVNLIIDDARHHLAHTDKQYDLILIGPSYAWVPATARLFTVEFLELAKSHLATDGLVALWFQLYLMKPPVIKSFVATVQQVFPHISLWRSSTSAELIAIASASPYDPDYNILERRLRLPAVRKELRRVMRPDRDSLRKLFLMQGPAVKAYVAGAVINTDDRPYLEFEAPRHLYDWDMRENLRDIRRWVRPD